MIQRMAKKNITLRKTTLMMMAEKVIKIIEDDNGT
jgi:hypothetical protein